MLAHCKSSVYWLPVQAAHTAHGRALAHNVADHRRPVRLQHPLQQAVRALKVAAVPPPQDRVEEQRLPAQVQRAGTCTASSCTTRRHTNCSAYQLFFTIIWFLHQSCDVVTWMVYRGQFW